MRLLIVPSKINYTFEQHIQAACNMSATLSQFNQSVIVGEWTPAYTDCAKYLNGRGVAARYDGSYPNSTAVGSCDGLTGSGDTFTQEYINNLSMYWAAQVCTASCPA